MGLTDDLDLTKLNTARPAKNVVLTVTDLDPTGAGSTLPRIIEGRTRHGDGALKLAMWSGNPPLVVSDVIRCWRMSGDTEILQVAGHWSTESPSPGAWPAAGKLKISELEYSTVAAAIAGASTNALIKSGEGSFACDNQTLPTGGDVWGSGEEVTTWTTSTQATALTGGGGSSTVVRDISITNTRSAAASTAFSLPAGSYLIAQNVRFVSSAHTDSVALYVDDSGILYNCTGDGGNTGLGLSVNDSAAAIVVVDVVLGEYDNIAVNDATINLRLHGCRITGTISNPGGGDINGWYVNANDVIVWLSNGATPFPGTVTIAGTQYPGLSNALAALSGAGELARVGSGSYDCAGETIDDDNMQGEGIDLTLLEADNADAVNNALILEDIVVLEDLAVQNTRSGSNGTAILCNTGSTVTLRRVRGTATSHVNSRGIVIDGDATLIDCEGEGGSTSLKALDIYDTGGANTTVTIDGGYFVGKMVVNTSTVTVVLVNNPVFTGGIDNTGGGDITGQYRRSRNDLQLYTPSGIVDRPASDQLGFDLDTTASSDSYTPATSNFSKSNTGTVWFFVGGGLLKLNSRGSGTARLIWTNSTGKNNYDAYLQWLTRAGTTYGGEIRFWEVQSPGGSDVYVAARFIYDATTYPDWPWRVQIWSGTGTTFSASDGTQRADAPWPIYNLVRLGLQVRTSGSTGQFDVFITTPSGPITDLQIGTYTPGGGPTGSFKTVYLYLPSAFQQVMVDSVVVT